MHLLRCSSIRSPPARCARPELHSGSPLICGVAPVPWGVLSGGDVSRRADAWVPSTALMNDGRSGDTVLVARGNKLFVCCCDSGGVSLLQHFRSCHFCDRRSSVLSSAFRTMIVQVAGVKKRGFHFSGWRFVLRWARNSGRATMAMLAMTTTVASRTLP